VARKIDRLRRRGRNFALLVVAEAVRTESGEAITTRLGDGRANYGGIGHYIGQRLNAATGAEVRVTVLGHVQRGGTPDSRDRLMASVFGVHAVDLLAAGKADCMVAWEGRTVTQVPLAEVVERPHQVDPKGPLVATARGLGVCFGDD
jgi:6-phosphofructokinase 1